MGELMYKTILQSFSISFALIFLFSLWVHNVLLTYLRTRTTITLTTTSTRFEGHLNKVHITTKRERERIGTLHFIILANQDLV